MTTIEGTRVISDMVRSEQLKTSGAIDCMICQPGLDWGIVRYSVPEYPLSNKEMTWNGSEIFYCQPTRVAKLFPTSVPASTSSAKGYFPYWNERYQENASRLLSHIEIDSLVSASTSLSGLSSVTKGRSWCLTK